MRDLKQDEWLSYFRRFHSRCVQQMPRISGWLQRTETQSKQLWQLMNSPFLSLTHTYTTSDLFSLFKWQQRSSSYCPPAHTLSSDICTVCLLTSEHPEIITDSPSGPTTRPETHCAKSLWHWLPENVCPANHNGYDSASGFLRSYEFFDCALSVAVGCPVDELVCEITKM